VSELTRTVAQNAGHMLARLKLSSAHAIDAFVVATALQFDTALSPPAIRTTYAASRRPFLVSAFSRSDDNALPAVSCLQRTGIAGVNMPPAFLVILEPRLGPFISEGGASRSRRELNACH